MPHATDLLNNSSALSSSPIPIPASTNYGRNPSSSSYSTSAVASRTTTINDLSDYNCNPLSLQDADNMNISFDQSYSAVFSSDETMYTPTITSDPVSRSLQQSYPRDYNCCGVDHQNLVDLLQHVDISHPGLIYDMVNGVIPFETTNVYSQDRWDSISTIPIPVSSIHAPLTTSMPNGSSHELKNNNFNHVTSASLYSVNVPSIINHKQKGSVNNNGLGQPNGYNQSELGQINGFDQINGLEQINGTTTGQNQDLLSCDWMLALLYDNNPTNPLRDPSFSSTLFGDQTLSSNSSSISTSFDDDNLLFDVPSKSLQMNQHQDPLLVSPLLSISTYPATPIDACLQSAASSPISSDDNSVVVSPITNDQTTNPQDNISQRHSSSQNTSYGSVNNISSSGQGSISSPDNDANTVNSQQRRSSSSTNQQTSYGSINNISNSRQRPVSSRGNDVHSHITTQHRPTHQLSSLENIKIEHGSPSADTNRTLPMSQRRFLPASSIDGNSISQPRRSSTSTIIPSQSVTQNEQYGINISNLGQGNISSSRPIAQLRRSSTSNLTTTARSIAATTTQAYSPFISIDKNKLAAYIPVTAAQYHVNTVDGYSLHVSSGETGSGAVPFAAKYHPIQPKAGGVAMSDVYSDPALDVSGIKGLKKRSVSTSSIDAKSTKRRVTKSSDESVVGSPVAVSADLSSEVENRSEADIYPYKCAVPGCIKAYKNANGLKYHNEHGHASQSGNGAREKPWACHIVGCLKTYGSKGGLVYHVKHCHPNDLWALP